MMIKIRKCAPHALFKWHWFKRVDFPHSHSDPSDKDFSIHTVRGEGYKCGNKLNALKSANETNVFSSFVIESWIQSPQFHTQQPLYSSHVDCGHRENRYTFIIQVIWICTDETVSAKKNSSETSENQYHVFIFSMEYGILAYRRISFSIAFYSFDGRKCGVTMLTYTQHTVHACKHSVPGR